MKRYRRWLLQLLVFVLLAVNLEVWCQYRLRAEGYEGATPIAVFDPGRGHRLKPAPGLSVNADGLRNPEVASPHPSAEIRILCLGGSVVFGWGLSESETFERVMEKALQARAPADVRINVINAGTPGFDSRNYAALLFDLAERYRPDIVIVVAGYNEPHVPALAAPAHTHPQETLPDRARTMLRCSATYRYLTVLLTDTSSRQGDWTEHSVGNLRLVADFAVAHGARCLVAFEPRREQAWMDRHPDPGIRDGRDASSVAALKRGYASVAERRAAIAYVDLDEALQRAGLPQDDLFQRDDPVHPTARGAAVIADALAEALRQRGWVPGGTPGR